MQPDRFENCIKKQEGAAVWSPFFVWNQRAGPDARRDNAESVSVMVRKARGAAYDGLMKVTDFGRRG
jgi:hypothetical protein